MATFSTHYIGIDIACDKFDVFFPTTSASKSLKTYSNNEAGWQQLIEGLSASDICVMEATGVYHLGLCLYLHNHNHSVCVVNPLSVKHFSRLKMKRAKTDKVDSVLLSEYGSMLKPKLWLPKAKQITDLQQLQTLCEQLIKQRTALKNQLQSFRLVPEFNLMSVETLEEIIEILDSQLKKLDSEIQGIIEQNYAVENKSLRSIPGIGPKTAAALLLITEGFTKFDNYKALIAYAGLAPRTFESGKSVKGASHICKLGARQLRKLLYECAHSAKRFNPVCKAVFDRLYHQKNKPFKVAMIAVANKLIKLAFAIVNSKSTFDIEYIRTE